MALDPERASLVSQSHRYAVRKDDNTLALYPNSKVIEINTNLDKVGGEALAAEMFASSGTSARTFTFTIEGVILLDDFVDGPPRFKLLFDRHPAADPDKLYTVIAAKPRRRAGLTTITVRG